MYFISLIDKSVNAYIISPFKSRARVAPIPKCSKINFKDVFLDANPNGEKSGHLKIATKILTTHIHTYMNLIFCTLN